MQSPSIQPKINQYIEENNLRGKLVISGVDELSQTNGILFKIQAFHRFLQDYKYFVNKIILVQVCFQQRSVSSTTNRYYEDQLVTACKQCNEEFPGSIVFHCLNGSYFSLENRLALWKVTNIYLNTSISQGLNLYPQEFLLARQHEGGIAIVSEFSSSHEFLNGALSINPWDINNIVIQLEKAISMGDEEIKRRQQRDIDNITKREKRLWACNVINVVMQLDYEESIQVSKQPGQELITEDLSPLTYPLDVVIHSLIH